MSSVRILRNYEINIEAKLLENEEIIVENNKLNKLLDSTRSTAVINVYMYLCLKVNKSKDRGYVRNTTCNNISNSIGIPLSTVQSAVSSLTKTNFIERNFNEDGSSDYKIIGYKNIFSKTYTKFPASMVLNNIFLQSSKDEVSCTLKIYSSIYSNTIAHMKKLQSINILKDKQNFELIGQAETNRVFAKKTLLKKIKRVNTKDLDRVLDKLQELGMFVKDMFREGIDKTHNYLIGISRDVLSSLFRPFISHSHIKNNPLAFNTVNTIINDTGLSKYVGKENHEDLTQMYVEYGDLFFNAGVVAIQKVVYDNYSLTDQDGSPIENLCAYFRSSVETFIENCKSRK